jgi:Predicted glycosyl hydrolase
MQCQNRIQCQMGHIYSVREGDSIQSIARAFDLSAKTIMENNPYVDPMMLIAGQVLCIPQRQLPQAMSIERVRFNESAKDLLKRCGLSEEEFLKANPSVALNRLMPGQRIQVPQP